MFVGLPSVVELLKFLPAKYVTYLCCQYPHLKWLSSQLFSPDFLHFSVVIGQELVQFLVLSLSTGRNSYWTSLDQDPSDHQKCPLLPRPRRRQSSDQRQLDEQSPSRLQITAVSESICTDGLSQGSSRKIPKPVRSVPCLNVKILFIGVPKCSRPRLGSDKSNQLEVSALWFLHKIPFILCLGRGVLSVETSDRRVGLAARKICIFGEKAQQSCPFSQPGTQGQNWKTFISFLQNF